MVWTTKSEAWSLKGLTEEETSSGLTVSANRRATLSLKGILNAILLVVLIGMFAEVNRWWEGADVVETEVDVKGVDSMAVDGVCVLWQLVAELVESGVKGGL